MDINNKVVIVTGAASGLGAATAVSFAKLNANLCLVDINEANLHKIEEECTKLTANKVLTVVADVNKDEEVKTIVDSALKELGKIDVLVNCAGIWRGGGIESSDFIETFDKIMSVNLRALVVMTKSVLPALIKSKGCIVNMSSISSIIEVTDTFVYSISKAAVTKFTKCAALELAKHGIRVNCILPGPVKTNILINAGVSESVSQKRQEAAVTSLPLKTAIKPEEVAELAVYLASDKAASITGSEFVIDAGMRLGICANVSNVSTSTKTI